MKKIKIVIFIFIVAAAFGAGIYLKDDAVQFYHTANKDVKNLQKIDISKAISQVGREIISPGPLNIGGSEQQEILLKSKIIAETNFQRQENGNLPALKENQILDQAASAKANDMFLHQYFEHVSPTGVDPGKLVQNSGYNYIVAGENLILGNFSSEKEVLSDWMASPGHRANILNNRYVEMGAAIIKGTYQGHTAWIGVQEFGLPLSACVEPDANLKTQINSDNAQLGGISSQIDEGKKQIDETDPNSPAYGQMIDDYNKLVSQYNNLAANTKAVAADYNAEVNNFNNCVAGK